jgi:hypothetical protein
MQNEHPQGNHGNGLILTAPQVAAQCGLCNRLYHKLLHRWQHGVYHPFTASCSKLIKHLMSAKKRHKTILTTSP